jgi:predicted ATPase
MGQRGERVIDALLASRGRQNLISRGKGKHRRSLEWVVAFWLKELGLIHTFRVEPISEGSNLYQVRVRRTARAPWVLVTDVGFGVSQILPVLTLCYYVPEGSTVILEQPEIHLHPSVQAGLADVLIDAVKTRGLQIILESHSEHLLRRLQRRIAEERLAPEEAALYFCETSDSGASELIALDVSPYGSVKNWPRDFFGDDMGDVVATTEAAMRRQMAEAGT